MRVGLDLLYLVPGESGGRESYARELIPAMLAQAPELELVAFVNRDAGPALGEELGERVHTVTIPVSARSRAQWALGEQALVPVAAARSGVQLLHAMANFAPAWGSFRCVLTLHDLQYLAQPELLSRSARAATHALVSMGTRRADRIIAVSRTGKDEICRGLRVSAGRIDVVANGVRRAPGYVSTVGLRERHGLDERPIVLTVATRLPHKNLPVLIDMLALITPEDRPMLVIAGHDTDDGVLAAAALAAGVGDSVRLLGRRTVEELDGLYALADCLVLPTLHEGFGLPVLEAMARSLPVACSAIPALREVAGDAALYFDPHDPSQIAARIAELTSDGPLASRLRELGNTRAAAFSWQAAAAGTLASYRKALAQ